MTFLYKQVEVIRQCVYILNLYKRINTFLFFWLFNNKDISGEVYIYCETVMTCIPTSYGIYLHIYKICVTLVRLSHRWELKMLFIYHIECNGKVGYNEIPYTINGIFSISFYLSKIVFVTEARRYQTLLSRYWKNRRRKNIYNQNTRFSSENIYVCVAHNAEKMTFSLYQS